MKKATTDPSKRLDIYLRIARNGSITFTFLDSSGAAYNISDIDFELFIKQNAGSRKDVISLLTSYAGFGLTFPTANQITATFTDTITEINEGEYYWELLVLDTNKTWLNGRAFFHNGEFDGVDQSDSIVIDNDGTDVTITINELVSPSGKYVGDFDPSLGIPTSGSGNNGAILKGDFWKASGSGTIADLIPFTAFVAGDLIYANVNNASVVGDFFGNKGTGGTGSGIAGSTGSTDNVLLSSDGVGGSTLKASPYTYPPLPAAVNQLMSSSLAGVMSWVNPFDIINPDISYYFQDDFIVGQFSSLKDNSQNGGASGWFSSGQDSTEKAIGVFGGETGTLSNGEISLVGTNGTGFILGFGNSLRVRYRARVNTLSDGTDTFSVTIGLIDNISTGNDHTDGCYFKYTHGTNSGRWQAITASNGTRTTQDTAVSADTLFSIFEVAVNSDATSVAFTINGVVVNTITTNIPTGIGRETFYGFKITKSAGTNNRFITCDWYDILVSRTTAR